jgi:rare lipoprotein A
MRRRLTVGIVVMFLAANGTLLAAESAEPPESEPSAAWADTVEYEPEGLASWYGGKFQGRLTANGEVFDTNQLTAAHKTLPFGTIVEVTHIASGRTVQVRINDRGPFVAGRIIDLSRAAAEALGMTGEGVAAVRLRIVSLPPEPERVVQIGSFSVRENALRVAAQLRSSSLVPTIEEAVGVYRVVVAPVRASQVDAVVEELRSLGFDSVLVRD